MVIGVTQGFEKKLQLVGVGYKAEKKGNTLVMNLGYSHPVEMLGKTEGGRRRGRHRMRWLDGITDSKDNESE